MKRVMFLCLVGMFAFAGSTLAGDRNRYRFDLLGYWPSYVPCGGCCDDYDRKPMPIVPCREYPPYYVCLPYCEAAPAVTPMPAKEQKQTTPDADILPLPAPSKVDDAEESEEPVAATAKHAKVVRTEKKDDNKDKSSAFRLIPNFSRGRQVFQTLKGWARPESGKTKASPVVPKKETAEKKESLVTAIEESDSSSKSFQLGFRPVPLLSGTDRPILKRLQELVRGRPPILPKGAPDLE